MIAVLHTLAGYGAWFALVVVILALFIHIVGLVQDNKHLIDIGGAGSVTGALLFLVCTLTK